MSMISNAELILRHERRVRSVNGELWDCLRTEFPRKRKEEVVVELDRASVLLTDLRKIEALVRKVADAEIC